MIENNFGPENRKGNFDSELEKIKSMETMPFVSSPVPITLEDVKTFCRVTGDTQEFHLSEEYAKQSFFGELVAPGAYISSLAIKSMWEMHSKTGLLQNCEVINLRSEAKYVIPTNIGESVTYEWKVLSYKEKKLKESDGLIISWEVTARNLDQGVVANHVWNFGYVKSNIK